MTTHLVAWPDLPEHLLDAAREAVAGSPVVPVAVDLPYNHVTDAELLSHVLWGVRQRVFLFPSEAHATAAFDRVRSIIEALATT